MEEKSGTILLETLTQMGLSPRLLTSNGLIEVEHQGKQFFFHHAKTSLNSQLASHLTGNKFLTRIILQNHALQNIPFLIPKSHDELVTFFETNSPVIMKPITGHYGQGVQKLDKPPAASYEGQLFEKYIDGVEYRYLILDGECVGVQRRDHAPTAEKPWEKRRVTISTDKWTESCRLNAIKVGEIMSLRFFAVDFLVDADGVEWILEVNSGPSIWPFHHPDEGNAIDVARPLIEKTLAL